MTKRRQRERPIDASVKSLKGIQAPTKTKAAMLNKRSITDENTDSSVCLLKKPSQAKAAPHENAARRSSEPRSVVVPMVSIASDTYCATYDCLSMRSFDSQNRIRCRNPQPSKAPKTMPKITWSVNVCGTMPIDQRGLEANKRWSMRYDVQSHSRRIQSETARPVVGSTMR